MSYVPHTDADKEEMLDAVGVERTADLFAAIPEDHRFPDLVLPPPMSEVEVLAELRDVAGRNANTQDYPCFLGAGAYHHFVPSIVDHVISRSEFYTAYTPYQAEISQGTLQSIFEYQSMICALTGMEVSNASHYDGATALAEAVIMAAGVSRGRRTRVVMAPTVHPEYRQTARTYTQGTDISIVGDEGWALDIDALVSSVDERTACLVVQTPDFFGRILDLTGVADAVHAKGALLVVACNPISLGMLNAPGSYDADIALGEGQPLGSPLNFGGPYLGFLACKQEYVRRMSGRLVGQTTDADGERGYVLTLSTREQHVRRGRATSNICSNQGLNALAAAVYLAAMGKRGLSRVAEINYHRAHYAAAQIGVLDAYDVDLSVPFFNEFVVRCPKPVGEINRALFGEYGIIGGYDLESVYPALENHMLLCATEMNPRQEIDELVEGLEAVAS